MRPIAIVYTRLPWYESTKRNTLISLGLPTASFGLVCGFTAIPIV